MINLNPVVLAVPEICTGVRKFKSWSPKLVYVPFYQGFCMPSKLLLVFDAHTKFEVYSFSRSKDIGARTLNIWASSVILDLTLGGF